MGKTEDKCVKLVYTRDYDTMGHDLEGNKIILRSKRTLLRAYEKAGISGLMGGETPFLLGYLRDNKFYDFFTGRECLVNGEIVEISPQEADGIVDSLGASGCKKLRDIMEVVFFGGKRDLGFDITTIDEMSYDRYKQWEAYLSEDTQISPYDRETMDDYVIARVGNYGRSK